MFNLDNIVVSIKENEGFRSLPYIDPLVRSKLQREDPTALKIIEEYLPTLNLTAGYGTLLNFSQKEGTVLLRARLLEKTEDLKRKKPLFTQLPNEAQEVLAEMAYQLGVYKLLKFVKMWEYLEEHDFKNAAVEMLDSIWAKQTPNRAEELAKRMSEVRS